MIPASQSQFSKVDWIPTGISSLDSITGGGFPTRRISECFGPYSVGKTSLALLIIKNAQALGYKTLWVDQEFTFDNLYAEHLGVDCDDLLFIQERHAEDALNEVEEFLSETKNAVVIIDAIGSLSPRAEAEKELQEKTIGGQASLIAKFCRKVAPLLALNNCALIVLNHQFTDIMTGALKSSGGAKLEYAKSLSVSLKRQFGKQAKREGDGKIYEVVVEAEVRKNKLAGTLGKKASLFMEPGNGFLVQQDLVQEAIDKGVLTKEGQSYVFQSVKVARGMKALREWIKENESAVKEAMK